ncbi:hypothetical protein ARMGADRAFT_497929 [Armillaria gallica]|uniref:Uncharacterized protein n=1 Tax=Armillaria gallica TaxID=47427 RepID=A0A2H3DVU4_ARMGA|nr:hypothetical protein ARMGADRAFT_497929 [Armillaria gallica]
MPLFHRVHAFSILFVHRVFIIFAHLSLISTFSCALLSCRGSTFSCLFMSMPCRLAYTYLSITVAYAWVPCYFYGLSNAALAPLYGCGLGDIETDILYGIYLIRVTRLDATTIT